jgi:hypothetical protein
MHAIWFYSNKKRAMVLNFEQFILQANFSLETHACIAQSQGPQHGTNSMEDR